MIKNLIVIFQVLALTLCVSCRDTAVVSNRTLVPKPLKLEAGKGTFSLKDGMTICVSDNSLMPAAVYFRDMLQQSTGMRFPVEEKTDGDIVLCLDSLMPSKAGGYTLDVTEKRIRIASSNYGGIISGISTVRQLLPAAIESRQVVPGKVWEIPSVSVQDEPRYGWRGVLLDVSRHFFDKEEVKELLDLMALYKLNKFQWHLTDDPGWRVEIRKYPLLTEKGAWRKLNVLDRRCVSKAVAEGDSSLLIPSDKLKIVEGDTLYGGFYTQADIREIVEYAKVRGIDVMPEIDMPGHMQTAVYLYDNVSCFPQKNIWPEASSPICPGKDSAMEFCKNVYAEIFELFPDSYVYIGADEVSKDNWKKCPDCQRRMKEEGLKNEDELQSWFVHELEQYFHRHGKKAIVWDEVMDGGVSPETTLLWWHSYKTDLVKRATAQGSDVILCPNLDCYLDYDETDRSMQLIYDFNLTEGLDSGQAGHVLGLQGNIWTEVIPSCERMLYMAFPRMLAVAENGWSGNGDWTDFRKRFVGQFPRLDSLDVGFRMPALEGFCDNNVFIGETTVDIICPDPEAVVYYTVDGTEPTPASALWTDPVTIDESTDFKFRVFRPDGRAGKVLDASYTEVAGYMPAVEDIPFKGEGLAAVWYKGLSDDCASVDKLPVLKRYVADKVEIPEGAEYEFGLVLNGYFRIPADGIYSFLLSSADGSQLKIDGVEIVRNEKKILMRNDVSGQCALQEGWHSIEVRNYNQYGGCLELHVSDPSGREIELEYKHE